MEGIVAANGVQVAPQDKKPHVAALTLRCFIYGFSDFSHITTLHRNVRSCIFSNDSIKNRTVQIKR
jgi:hypothetical protein